MDLFFSCRIRILNQCELMSNPEDPNNNIPPQDDGPMLPPGQSSSAPLNREPDANSNSENGAQANPQNMGQNEENADKNLNLENSLTTDQNSSIQNANSNQTEKIYEMQWDCPQCGTKKLLGKTHRFCPACGNPQDPTKRYFPTEEEKVAVQDHKFVGADRICGYCNAANSAVTGYCTQCGGPMDGTEQVKLAHETPEPSAPEPEKKSMRAGLKWGLIGGAAAIIGFCGVFMFWTKTVQLEVTSQKWVRTIDIEQKRAVSDSSWCPAPSGAYNITQQREQNGTEQVADGQTCRTVNKDRGDGTFSQSQECSTKYKSVPVYDQKCYYTIDRWVVQRTLTSEGTAMMPVTWPSVPYLQSGNSLGSQREGTRTETYIVNYKVDDGSDNSCKYKSDNLWKAQTVGSKWQGEMGVLSSSIDCDELQKL